MPVHQAVGGQGTEFDVLAFTWIGNTTSSPNLISAWHTTGITHITDVFNKELTVGAPTGTAAADLSACAEHADRHEVQGHHRLSRRQRRQLRDGARRGRRARLELVGGVEGDAAALARREEDPHPRADRARAASRAAGRAADVRAGAQPARTARCCASCPPTPRSPAPSSRRPAFRPIGSPRCARRSRRR